jgi:translation initiation factor 2B subunit (eIF-2B alpha/beta/delta family)
VERILRRELDSIARNHRAGASELGRQAAAALERWRRSHATLKRADMLEVASALFQAQPSMAPLMRLANEMALAADAADPAAALDGRLAKFADSLRAAPGQIARLFARWMNRGPRRDVVTYSYSSTVVKALVKARRRIASVSCSESRPGYEGIVTARRLGRAKIPTWLLTDAGLFSQSWRGHVVVLGADAVLKSWLAVKVGTRALLTRAREAGCEVVILADTSKFWPEPSRRSVRWAWTFGPPEEIWAKRPSRVRVHNLYFELIGFARWSGLRLLTEHGWMTPRQARRFLKRIVISPRLGELAD